MNIDCRIDDMDDDIHSAPIKLVVAFKIIAINITT